MGRGERWLRGVADRMRGEAVAGAAVMPERLSVRDLLRQFGYERRGRIINRRIQNLLEKLDLQTEPDFTAAWLDGAISISLLAEGTDQPSVDTMPDPTLVVGSLPAAHVNEPPNDGLVSVAPDQPLLVATTLMQLHDFSQLPVMPGGSKRDVKGVISWQTIGVRRALELPSEYVRDCMDRAAEIVPIDMPLFEAIGRIARRGYALVQKGKGNNEITGIVTVSDLSEHFFDLAGPFFLLGQIEGNLRLLIHGKFRVNEMQEVADHRQGDGTITGSADLTFGEYCRLLENEQRWQKADIKASRKEFIAHLELAREIRNDVMHFDPDGLSEHDLRSLLQISQFVELLTHAIRS